MPFIPLEAFTDLAQGTVTAGGTAAPASGTIETWTVNVTTAFPAVEYGAQQFHLSDPLASSEIITGLNTPGGLGSQSWTVMRGAGGTIPVAHTSGFTIVGVTPASVLANLQYPPWQFPVQAYGAQGDGKIGTGGTGTSGTATFTDAGASFVNAAAPAGDVGKVIVINQGTGGSATNPFCGTITAVNSATSVTLSANLAATAASAPYVYGTDDSAAITAAVNAASTWAQSTGNFKAQVMFEPQLYMLGALTQTTNGGAGPVYNTHIPIPFTTQLQRKLIIDLVGVGDASEPDFWGSTVPGAQGTCLVSAVFPASQPDATFGQVSVIGVPNAQTGIGTGGITGGGFANVLVNIDGISLITPFNSQIYGFDFRFACQANIQNAAVTAFAPVNFTGATVGGPWLRATNIPANGVAFALAMPVCQNNDNCNIGLFSCEGISRGILISEHITAQRICTIYCDVGLQVTWVPSGTTEHGGAILYWSCEGCNTGISTVGADATHNFPLFIGSFDCEVINTFYVNDPSGCLTGTAYIYDISVGAPGAAGTLCTNWNLVNCRMFPGPWTAAENGGPAPPSAPASATAQQNVSFRQATVYASATTSITNTATGPASAGMTVLGQTGGANSAVPVRVPSGHWYSVTYTGTLTTRWVLE